MTTTAMATLQRPYHPNNISLSSITVSPYRILTTSRQALTIGQIRLRNMARRV
jgi:hypothetical protein